MKYCTDTLEMFGIYFDSLTFRGFKMLKAGIQDLNLKGYVDTLFIPLLLTTAIGIEVSSTATNQANIFRQKDRM